MGAWGPGNFENDDALDLLGELGDAGDAAPLEALFEPVVAHSREGAPPDASDSARVLAAAELIAAARGWPSSDFPDDASAYVQAITPPDSELVMQASEAVSSVLLSSELLQLWEESDDAEEWNKVLTGLIERLGNPARKAKAKKQPKDPLLAVICSFCSEQIRKSALVELSVKRPDMPETFERGIYAHAECLNAKLHPRHILQWWRFPDA